MLPLSARSTSVLSDLARSYLDALRDERGLGGVPLRDTCFSAGANYADTRKRSVTRARARALGQLDLYRHG